MDDDHDDMSTTSGTGWTTVPTTTITVGPGGGGIGGGNGGGGSSGGVGVITASGIPTGSLHFSANAGQVLSYNGSTTTWIPIGGNGGSPSTFTSQTLGHNYSSYVYVRKNSGQCVSLDVVNGEYHYAGKSLVDVLVEYGEIYDMASAYSEVQEALDHLRTLVKLRRE